MVKLLQTNLWALAGDVLFIWGVKTGGITATRREGSIMENSDISGVRPIEMIA